MRKLNNYTNNTKQALHPQNNSINAGAIRQSTEIRQYKDNVFCLLYRDKNNLLDLYNGLNDTNYTNVNDLTVTTLKGGVYMKYKNDASFVFGQDLYMFEQQSSRNPNMPLRFLHYLSDVYRQMYNNSDLHRSTTLKIPVPHFVTFYNGKQPLEAESILRLSDMYEKNIDCPELELMVRVININTDNNAGNKSRTFNSNINDNSVSNSNIHTYSSEFLSKCETLKDYMIFVNKEWDEIDDIIVYSNYHKYWQNKELRIKNPYFDVFSGRILDLKEGKQSAVKYFYNLINEEICKDVTICVVPSSDADKKESGIGMLGEMLAADGRKNKVYYLQRTKSIDKLAYGGCRDRQVHMKTISTVDSINVDGDIILLMDDVTTTGNSLYACREILMEKGAKTVKMFALGKAV